MYYTLGEAAKRTGLSKPTVQRAIKSGKLSASRNDDGSYSIDPAELERVYTVLPVTSDANGHMKQDETPIETVGLQVELAVLREKLSSASIEREREREILNRQIEDLQRRLDSEAEARRQEGEERRKLTAILTDQRQPAPQPAPEAPRKPAQGFFARLVRGTG